MNFFRNSNYFIIFPSLYLSPSSLINRSSNHMLSPSPTSIYLCCYSSLYCSSIPMVPFIFLVSTVSPGYIHTDTPSTHLWKHIHRDNMILCMYIYIDNIKYIYIYNTDWPCCICVFINTYAYVCGTIIKEKRS